MKQANKLYGTILALGALAIPAQASVVFVGSLQNDSSSEISLWSDTGTTKSLDLDGNNYYGSDGYSWMNTDDATGAFTTVFHGLAESAPSYTSGIAYTGSGTGSVGSSASFSGADDRLIPAGTGTDDVNVGYAGINYGSSTGATVMQELFAYTMNRDMVVGETIRLGVVLDSLNDPGIGADALRVVAGDTADATGVTRSSVMDMYFFDITGLSSGEEIQIWGSKATDTTGFNAITIGGVTFDSVPEPSTTALLGLGGLALILRRRK